MITLDRVSKVYSKSHKPALENVTLFIAPKEFAIIVGASGAGKSTLLKLLTREEKQTSGKIIVGGIDYDALDDRDIPLLRRRIGVVFQDFKLLPNRTVFENVALSLEISGHSNRQIRENVPKILELVGLRGKEKSFPRELSGGERQRVAIARAIVTNPTMILADEPTGNLDSRSGAQVLDLLAALHREGRTLVVVTHDPAVARRADRVLVLRDGTIAKRVAGRDVTDLNRLFDFGDAAP